MAGSSYAVKREHLSQTAALVAQIIDKTPEKSVSYSKLEQMLFLADWKCAQSIGQSKVDTSWIHNDETVTAVELFDRLKNDNHFVLSDTKNPRACRVSMARKFEITLAAEIKNAVGTHLRFLDGQGPSALKKMCKDSYPMRSSRAGKKFRLDERILAYNKSRRVPA